MRAKINILLLSVSFCFASMKTTDVMASFDSGSEDPVSLFKSALPDIDLEQTYSDCSLKNTFKHIAQKKAHDPRALTLVRTSQKRDLVATYGRGHSLLRHGDRKNYKEFYMLGNGNCGLYSLGTTFEAANALLLANAGNAAIRQMAHNEIFDIFNSNEMNRLPSQMIDNPRYRQLSEDLSDQEIRILTGAARPHEVIAEKNRLVAAWAQEEQTFRDYVTYGLTNGNFMDYRQDEVTQDHFNRDVFTTRTYFLDTIGFLLNKNLRVWQQMDGYNPIEGRALEWQNQTIQLFHDQVHNPAWETVDLIHRGNHYNRIVPTDNANALAQGAIDEENHLAAYSYITMNMGMSHRYKKVLNGVLGDVIANPNAPLSMQAQGRAYQSAYLSDAELQKASTNISISSADKTVTQIVLARAYALKAQELEKKQNRTQGENAKILDYKAKANTLKRQTPEHLTQDLIDVEAMQIYQYARSEKDAFEDAGIAATANPVAALAYEIDEIATALYKNTDRFLRTKKDDARYIYLKKFQKAQAEYAATVLKNNGMYLSEYNSHPWADAHNEALQEMNRIARMKRTARQAFLNPELIKNDPYLSVWNTSIDQDPNYATNLTSGEFNAIKDDVLIQIKLAGWDADGLRQISYTLGSIWVKINTDTAQAKFLQRRVKRVYDAFLGKGEGATPAAKKIDACAKFAMAITANEHGCITGQEESVKKLEDGLFGAKEALSAGSKISKIIIKDRQKFIYDHGKTFTMHNGQEPHLNIPVLLNKRLSVAFSLGAPVAPMYAIGCGKPDEGPLQPSAVVNRYFNGGRLIVGDHYGTASARVDFEARTPEFYGTKLLEAYKRSVKKSNLGRRSNTALGKEQIVKLRTSGSIQEKARYSERSILDRAIAGGLTQNAVENRKIIVFGESSYEEHVRRAHKEALKLAHGDDWKTYWSENKNRLIQGYSRTEGARRGLDAEAYKSHNIQMLGREEFLRQSAEQAGEPLYTNVVKRASEANLRRTHGDDWEDEWDDQQDDLIEQYSQAQGMLLGLDADAYKNQEIQRLGANNIRVSGVNQYKYDTWKETVLNEAYEAMALSIKSDLDSEIEQHGELSLEDLEGFIRNNPDLKAEYESDEYTVDFDDTKHFIAGGGADQFRPEFFMYMLKKFGYVIDPNDPMESYLGASDNENKAYIAKVDEARNADFAKLMGVSAAKARSENTIRAEIRRLQAGPQSRGVAQQIEALEREINPNRPRVVPISAPVPHVSQPSGPVAPYVSQPNAPVSHVSQPASFMSVSEVVSSGASIEQQIAMLESLPSSRTRNNTLTSLKQRLENPGSVLPSVSVPSVPAPLYSISSRSPAPSVVVSGNAPAQVSPHDIMQEIEMLEALPTSRRTRLQIQSLRQRLENPGSALPSVSVPSVSRPAVAPYVPGGSSIPVPSVGSGSSVPAPVVLNRVDIERRIGELESQAMSRNTRLELDRLRTQLATL